MFVTGKVTTFLQRPINFESTRRMLKHQAKTENARTLENMALCEHVSEWKMRLYLAVDKDIYVKNSMKMTGTYYSKVFEGDISNVRKCSNYFDDIIYHKGANESRVYIWYISNKMYKTRDNKNYLVFITRID